MLTNKAMGAGGFGGEITGTVAYKTVSQDPATSSLSISFTSGWTDAATGTSISGNPIETGDMIFVMQSSNWRTFYGGTITTTIPSGYTGLLTSDEGYIPSTRQGSIQVFYRTVGATVPTSVTMTGTATSSAYGRLVTVIVCRGVSFTESSSTFYHTIPYPNPTQSFDVYSNSGYPWPTATSNDYIIQIVLTTYSNYSTYSGFLVPDYRKDLYVSERGNNGSTTSPYAYNHMWAQFDGAKGRTGKYDVTFTGTNDPNGGSRGAMLILSRT